MALINCSECNKEVSDKALNCPKCGNPIADIITSNESYQVEKRNKGGCFKTLLVAFVVFVIGVAIVESFSDSSNSNAVETQHSELLAFNYAMDCVKSRLKSPSSAIFANSNEKKQSVTYNGSGVYVVRSWVESQNSFGAMLRSNFECTVKFEGTKVSCESVTVY
ncbi:MULTISPECIES: zinc ribbon domain-containing protein [Myroides]|uniref:zinc ribbon domain-containing protein n=1 Tax=Myroides TaxID=76831 RepID=UPI000741C56B|nr:MULTISPECIES: zinc ribbon domain-containing protein [Myroides]KUF45257.1 hypothetical protein AS361_06345 [Myroides marinus]MDM1092090.1 zinc ribbon domain-containing protein [Myroides odoratimimus]